MSFIEKFKPKTFAKKKKGSDSSDGGKSDEDNNSEQAAYFNNEEKMIKNNLKLNVTLQVIQLLIFIVAAACFDWTHVTTNVSTTKDSYHVSLLRMEAEDVLPVWLFHVASDCSEDAAVYPYPPEICERAGSLFVAGLFVSLQSCFL